MASYLQIENISKSYGPKVLFEHIGFNINEGDKIALIAPNGTGKTSLMRILAGKDKSDSGGKILFLKNIRIAFLEQDYDFDPEKDILTQVLSDSPWFPHGSDVEHQMEYEMRVKKFLSNFSLNDFGKKMKELSGGEVKRVALAGMLASEADFFIMDEPTNHLDIDAIEFLEGFLSRSRCTLLMVTHDRYFLDRVCNTVMELDRGAVYTYRGDYQNYLEKREERISNWNAETEKVRNVLRRELEWIRSTPCARTGKAKYRIDAFHDLRDRAQQTYVSKQISLSEVSGSSRLGTKIINCKGVSFSYGEECYLDNFSYNFQRYEKVGIVGRNGAGKTTFINLLTGEYNPEDVDGTNGLLTGTIERGESLKIGYYRQTGMEFNPEDTVLDVVNDTRLLGQFLFTHNMLSTRVGRLSGGERRRLYLLTILMKQPNLLILDEPTNDLDIVTINILEEYLKEFKGTLIIVSHDRHFLDRLVDHLFVFCGKGVVKDFIGSYSGYRSFVRDYEAAQKASARSDNSRRDGSVRGSSARGSQESGGDFLSSAAGSSAVGSSAAGGVRKPKLTYREQRELEQLEKDLADLASEKASLEESISSGTLPYDALQRASERIGEIISLTDAKETHWLELSEKLDM